MKFIWAILFVLLIGATFYFYFGDVDSCMDSGGCWDSTSETCRKNEIHAQLLCHRDRMDICSTVKQCDQGYTCVSVASLKNPICIKKNEVCTYICNESRCNIFESYPVQVTCNK